VLRELIATVSRADEQRFSAVLAGLTRNPAEALGLRRKGRIAPGMDGDLMLFDPESGAVTDLFCAGRALLRDGRLPEIAPGV
jgi:beta-aspartyl-dipeptidase (metallo-type)